MNVTLREIAQRAQVSRGTVDRVIHNRYGVSPEIRARVLQILKEADYRPNAMAKALQGAQNPIKLGVIVPNRRNPFYMDIHAGVDEAVKNYAAYGITILKIEMEDATYEKQAKYIDELVAQDICGLALVPIDNEHIAEKINALPDDFPVVTLNSDIRGTKRLCFVGNNHIAAGRVAGKLMSTILQNGSKVATVISQMDFLAHAERVCGFQQIMSEQCPDTQVLSPVMTYESEERSFELFRELLTKPNGPDAIYMAGGGQSAAARAMRAFDPNHRVKEICHDLLPETVRNVKDGLIDFTIGQEPFMQGYMSLEILYEYHVFGMKPKMDKLYTPIDIRLKENVELKGYEVFTGLYSQKRMHG